MAYFDIDIVVKHLSGKTTLLQINYQKMTLTKEDIVSCSAKVDSVTLSELISFGAFYCNGNDFW